MNDRPRSLRYRQALDEAEARIVAALPEIIDGLVRRAKEGDAKASFYLLDRILGRAAGAKAAPVDDRQAPYTEADWEGDEAQRESSRDLLRMFRPTSGAGNSL